MEQAHQKKVDYFLCTVNYANELLKFINAASCTACGVLLVAQQENHLIYRIRLYGVNLTGTNN